MERFFCAGGSRGAAEGMLGTAPVATRWLLVPVAGGWAPDALDSEGLSEPLREALRAFAAGPGQRVQLVGARAGAPRVAWWAESTPGAEALWRWRFDSDEALVADLVAGVPPARAERVAGPLWLVCTHGKRDACCARWGMAAWRALVEATEGPVLQASHLGGHRFAPVAVSLPSGLVYGRFSPEDAPTLAADALAGRVSLPFLRGRAALAAPAQVAEALARAAGGDVDSPVSEVSVRLDGERAAVRLRLGGRPHELALRRTPGPPLRTSCGDAAASPTAAWRDEAAL